MNADDRPGEGQGDAALREATDWLLRLREAPEDAALLAGLRHWLAADPAHARAWERANRAWQIIGEVQPSSGRTDAGTRAMPPARKGKPPRQYPRIGVGLVALALAACLTLVFLPSLLVRLHADHATAAAETRRIALEDGSRVHLAPQSAVTIAYTEAARSVRLISGRAFFEVAPDAQRPFTVSAGGLEATALGTAFDVAVSDRTVSVSVATGAVGVWQDGGARTEMARLGPGDRLQLDRLSGSATRTRVAPEEVADWRDGQLFVAAATVAELVEALAPYYAGWILITDESLARAQVTGLYDLHDPERALRAIVQPAGGQVRRVTPLLYVLSRR